MVPLRGPGRSRVVGVPGSGHRVSRETVFSYRSGASFLVPRAGPSCSTRDKRSADRPRRAPCARGRPVPAPAAGPGPPAPDGQPAQRLDPGGAVAGAPRGGRGEARPAGPVAGAGLPASLPGPRRRGGLRGRRRPAAAGTTGPRGRGRDGRAPAPARARGQARRAVGPLGRAPRLPAGLRAGLSLVGGAHRGPPLGQPLRGARGPAGRRLPPLPGAPGPARRARAGRGRPRGAGQGW